MMYDILIVGGGPAGLSAAVNAAARGKRCAVLSNDYRMNPLFRSEKIDNYLGMRGLSGEQMLRAMRREAEEAGAAFVMGRVTSILPMGDSFAAAMGNEVAEGKRLILATGAKTGTALPGEERFLGRGVSTCATCDGMLYRGKRAVVTGDALDLAEEARFLKGIGVDVTVVAAPPQRSRLGGLPPEIPSFVGKQPVIEGEERLEGFSFLPVDGEDRRRLDCDVVFLLREVAAPDALVPGLALEGKYVAVDRAMRTNIPGLYAAGDCTGLPLQVAKAVGEGLIAAQDAARSLR